MIASPRIARPHTITVLNFIKEDDNGVAKYQKTIIEYVRLEENYGIIQSQKGIKTNDDAMLVIDMNDLVAYNDMNNPLTYLNENEFSTKEDKTSFFTFRKGKDIVMNGKSNYDNNGYIVNTVKEICALSSNIEFIEIGLSNGQ